MLLGNDASGPIIKGRVKILEVLVCRMNHISSFRQGFWAGIQCFWPEDMRIGKNIPVWENLTFRHSGRAFGPESVRLGARTI